MQVKEIVREKYGEAARRVIEGKGLPSDCCSKTSCCDGSAAASCAERRAPPGWTR